MAAARGGGDVLPSSAARPSLAEGLNVYLKSVMCPLYKGDHGKQTNKQINKRRSFARLVLVVSSLVQQAAKRTDRFVQITLFPATLPAGARRAGLMCRV